MKNFSGFIFLCVCLILRSIQFATEAFDTKSDPVSVVYCNYSVDAFHRLTSHKIYSTFVNSRVDCAMACVTHWECLSFNLGIQMTAEKQECELIRTDKYNSNSTYSNSSNFHHFFVSVSLKKVSVVVLNSFLLTSL